VVDVFQFEGDDSSWPIDEPSDLCAVDEPKAGPYRRRHQADRPCSMDESHETGFLGRAAEAPHLLDDTNFRRRRRFDGAADGVHIASAKHLEVRRFQAQPS
jgi:hypothetical protein